MKKKIIYFMIIDIIVSIVLFFVLFTFNSVYVTNRADPEETVPISDSYKIEQRLNLKNKTLSLNVALCVNQDVDNFSSNEKIIFRLKQNDNCAEYDYSLDKLKISGWTGIKLKMDYSKFKKGESLLSIEGKNIPDGAVSVLITSGTQKSIEKESVVVAGEKRKDCFLSLECKTISYYRMWNKLLYSVGIATLSIIAVYVVCILLKNFPVTGLAIMITLLMVVRFRFFIDFPVDGWVQGTWMSDYRYGFIGRGFAASLLSIGLKIFTGSTFISDKFLHNFLVFITMLVALVCIYFIYVNEKKCKESKSFKKNEIILYFWILSPWFVTYFMTSGGLMGRLDILLLAYYICSCLLIIYNKCIFLVPVLTVMGVLTYPIYTIIYFPTIFLFFVEIYLKNRNKKNMCNIVFLTIPTLLLTLYFRVAGSLRNRIPMSEYYAAQLKRTDQQLLDTFICAYPYKLVVGETDVSVNHLILRMVLLILFSMLSLSFVANVWKHLISKSKNKIHKICYFGFMVAPFSIIMLFNASDLMKYMVGIYTSFITGPIVMSYIDEDVVTDAVAVVNENYERKLGSRYLLIHIAVFSVLGVTLGTAWPFSELTDSIISFLQGIS